RVPLVLRARRALRPARACSGAASQEARVKRLAILLAAALAFLIVEISLGAVHFGQPKSADPCTAKPAFKGGGIDGEAERVVRSGLNGAACKLHTTREELVLSFAPAAGTKRVRWDRQTIDDALKAGFDQAFKDTEERGIAGLVIGHVLQALIGEPVKWLLNL